MTSVLAIAKFPPTQGGTANQLLWLTVRLAELGVDVAVVDASYALDPRRRR